MWRCSGKNSQAHDSRAFFPPFDSLSIRAGPTGWAERKRHFRSSDTEMRPENTTHLKTPNILLLVQVRHRRYRGRSHRHPFPLLSSQSSQDVTSLTRRGRRLLASCEERLQLSQSGRLCPTPLADRGTAGGGALVGPGPAALIGVACRSPAWNPPAGSSVPVSSNGLRADVVVSGLASRSALRCLVRCSPVLLSPVLTAGTS